MTTTPQTEAMRLADLLKAAVQIWPQMSEDEPGGYMTEVDQVMDDAAAELRRLDAVEQNYEGLKADYQRLTASNDQLRAQVDGMKEQHHRDSAELRSLCQARDDARKQRDLCRVEIAGLESSVSHLSLMVDEQIRLVQKAVQIMKALHESAKPEDSPEMNAIIPADAFHVFVDGYADLMCALANGPQVTTAVPPQVERLQGGEPVAWINTGGHVCDAFTKSKLPSTCHDFNIPIYTAQPAAPAMVPLSRTRVLQLWNDVAIKQYGMGWHEYAVNFAAAIEQDHGIGQPVGGEAQT